MVLVVVVASLSLGVAVRWAGLGRWAEAYLPSSTSVVAMWLWHCCRRLVRLRVEARRSVEVRTGFVVGIGLEVGSSLGCCLLAEVRTVAAGLSCIRSMLESKESCSVVPCCAPGGAVLYIVSLILGWVVVRPYEDSIVPTWLLKCISRSFTSTTTRYATALLKYYS